MRSLTVILGDLKSSDPRLYAGIKKWLPLLESSIKKICRITGEEAEDVLQDLLMGLSAANSVYDIPLYRYKNCLYEEVCIDGSLVCLQTLRTRTRDSKWFWTSLSNVERVKKGKLEFVVGMRIRQQCYDIIKDRQRAKYGWEKTRTDKKIAKCGGIVKHGYNAKKVVNFEQFTDAHLSSGLFSGFESPESLMGYVQCVERIKEQTSSKSFCVFRLLLEDPGIDNPDIAKLLNMPLDEVKQHRQYLRTQAKSFGKYL